MSQLPMFTTVERRSKGEWRPELPNLSDVEHLFLDFETTGLRWWAGDRPIGAAVRTRDGRSWYIPWGHRGGGNLPEDRCKEWFRREMRNKRVENLNIRFDLHMAYEWGVDLEAQGCTVGDVGHYAALLDDTRKRGFSLDELSKTYLQKGKVVGLDIEHLADYHAADVADYAQTDTQLAQELRDYFWPLLSEQDLHEVRELEDAVIFPVCEMERNGAKIDVEKLDRWIRETEQELLRTIYEIREESGIRVSPDSSGDCLRLFKALGIEIQYFTETGQASFTDEILKTYEHPTVKKLRWARDISSLRSKYLLKYRESLGVHDILRYALHQLRADEGGTISGRFASSGYRLKTGNEGANIQQVFAVEKQKARFGDRWIIRELFIPESGLFLASDAAQIEYRLLVHFANSQKLIDVYKKNPYANFHKEMWPLCQAYYPEITYKHQKNVDFAYIFGAGIRKMADMLGVSYDAAEQVKKAFETALPEAKTLMRKASNAAETRGFIRTLLKRRSRFPGRERLHKALNNKIQGSAADINKRKIVELHEARKRTGFKMRLTVHDEIAGDAPSVEAAKEVDTILNRQSYDLRVPILWETETGANWKECA